MECVLTEKKEVDKQKRNKFAIQFIFSLYNLINVIKLF